MHLVYHLAALHDPSGVVLVSTTPAGWTLPTLVAHDDIAMTRVFTLARDVLPVAATVRCVVRWQMHATARSADATLVMDLVAAPDPGDDRFAPFLSLLTRPPLMRYQAEALHELATRNRADPRAVFLEPHWIETITDWVARVTGHQPRDLVRTIEILRAEPSRVVVTFLADAEPLHFKADNRTPFVEALVTRFIATRVDGVVAPTHALDIERGWQLTRHVEGAPLDADCWPAHLAALEAWLGLQRALAPCEKELTALGVQTLTPDRLRAAVAGALRDLEHEGGHADEATRAIERVDALLASPLVVDMPPLVLHFDLAPRNVLWHRGRAVFLDLDTLHIGPSVVAGELMGRRMKGVLSPEQRQQLSQHGARQLLRAVRRSDLEPHLHEVAPLADVCLLAWRREQLWNDEAAARDPVARLHTSTCLTRDFLARLS
jgi:hypothetical protein